MTGFFPANRGKPLECARFLPLLIGEAWSLVAEHYSKEKRRNTHALQTLRDLPDAGTDFRLSFHSGALRTGTVRGPPAVSPIRRPLLPASKLFAPGCALWQRHRPGLCARDRG